MLFERFLLLDGAPLSVWTSYLPADRAERLLSADLELDLYELVEHNQGVELGSAEIVTEAVAADRPMAELLGFQVGAPMLHLERLTREKSGRPFEFGFVWLRGDRIKFVSHLHRDEVEEAR